MRFARLKQEHKDLIGEFSSGNKDLDDFIRNDALKQQELHISTTFLLFEEPDVLVGYLTLLSDSIRIKENPTLSELFNTKGIQYHTLPALRIGRLASRKDFQKKGYGRAMIKFALSRLFEISENAGCRFLTADSKLEAVEFYRKVGFETVATKEGETVKVYLDAYLGKN